MLKIGMIRENKKNAEQIDLTPCECKFVEIMCNGKINSWDEISDYIFWYCECGHDDKCLDMLNIKRSLYTIKTRLTKKTKMKFIIKRGYGVRLTDLIYIE